VWQVVQAQGRPAEFKMVVEVTKEGAKFECLSGCGWKTLSYGCEGQPPCAFQLDQNGVGPVTR